MRLSAYVKILRPPNAAMAAGAVCLGAWIVSTPLPVITVAVLAAVAACATGFGNIVNDIVDIETDRISHPDRPLVRGAMSRKRALIYAILLAVAAVVAASIVSPLFGIAALLPLLVLALYAVALKGTPLAGNVIVSLLVAYALLFGGLPSPHLSRLVIPALLATLLNFSREIIKDIQDDAGDRAAGVTTAAAALSRTFLKKLIYACSGFYAPLLFLPCLFGHFGVVYAVIVSTTVIPLHCRRLFLLKQSDWEDRVALISLLLKIEMVCGLAAMAIDRWAVK